MRETLTSPSRSIFDFPISSTWTSFFWGGRGRGLRAGAGDSLGSWVPAPLGGCHSALRMGRGGPTGPLGTGTGCHLCGDTYPPEPRARESTSWWKLSKEPTGWTCGPRAAAGCCVLTPALPGLGSPFPLTQLLSEISSFQRTVTKFPSVSPRPFPPRGLEGWRAGPCRASLQRPCRPGDS